MDPEDKICDATWIKSSSSDEPFHSLQQKWDDSSLLNFQTTYDEHFSDFNEPSFAHKINKKIQTSGEHDGQIKDWDPMEMLNNLSVLEKKIHQLRDMVHLVAGQRELVTGRPGQLLVHQQQLITTDLTSIIAQLISTAGSLLPKHAIPPSSEAISSLGVTTSSGVSPNFEIPSINGERKVDPPNQTDLEEHELKSDDDADMGENLPPGSYEILQLEKDEILAPHTHFCTICGKGFKRDANLRMHMRGHGDEYKTPAALAKPHKESNSESIVIKRYSCPYVGCKRNRDHKKFQPLKTVLCVKNHYKRTHCDKTYTCSRCNAKKFSVLADLKTHEKHCGRDKWLCSCGTTFSRKDKLFGHITLFQGHAPAIPADADATSDRGQSSAKNAPQNVVDMKFSGDDPANISQLNFETSAGGLFEFPRLSFEDAGSSFSFLVPEPCRYPPNNGNIQTQNM